MMSLLHGLRGRSLSSKLLFSCLLIQSPSLSICFLSCFKRVAQNVLPRGHGTVREIAFRLVVDRRFDLRSTSDQVRFQDDGTIIHESGLDEGHFPPQSFLAAIEPGSTLRIQIGDASLARKAWKKRRRNKSPLLVPCSLLTKDLHASLQDNVLYLVKKFGSPRLSVGELLRRHRSHLLAPMSNATIAAVSASLQTGWVSNDGSSDEESLVQLLLFLFPPGNAHGLDVSQRGESGLWSLQLRGVSFTKARKQAAAAAVVQFRYASSALCDNVLCWEHTGLVRTKSDDGKYRLQPLSAALRIPNHQNGEILSGMGSNNDGVVSAFVWDFDERGDAGSPMIVLSLQPLVT